MWKTYLLKITLVVFHMFLYRKTAEHVLNRRRKFWPSSCKSHVKYIQYSVPSCFVKANVIFWRLLFQFAGRHTWREVNNTRWHKFEQRYRQLRGSIILGRIFFSFFCLFKCYELGLVSCFEWIGYIHNILMTDVLKLWWIIEGRQANRLQCPLD